MDTQRLLLEILRMEDIPFEISDVKKLVAFIEDNIDTAVSADFVTWWALSTVKTAVKEIRLKGDILTASVLWMTLPIEKSNEVLANYGEGVCRYFVNLHEITSHVVKQETLQSDNYRNLLVSQAQDMRVVLLLIADSVSKMRNAKMVSDEDVVKKWAMEAGSLYAPLAHKLGLYQLKSELEDLSLKYLESDAYYYIRQRLNETKKSRDAYIANFIAPIRSMLESDNIKCHIKGRTKSIHSIWQKMRKQHCDFDGVYDLFAIRIIVDAPSHKEKELCWKVFSLITSKYESNLKRLRDWITVPKTNGYESLHITVLGPFEKWVEVQIRTERMDEVAEHGLAAHWRYKGVRASGGIDEWLSDIRNALENNDECQLQKNLTVSADGRDVYVFTPKGDVYRLPPKSTVLDFAYLVHTEVGNKCVGAIVDGKNVPIRHRLESGKKVEIVTSHTQCPKMEWLTIAVSSHAKSKIRSSVRDLQVHDARMGREMLERKLKNRKIDWDENVLNQLIKRLGFKESFEFYKSLYDDSLEVNLVIEKYVDLQKREAGVLERAESKSADEFDFQKGRDAHENTGPSKDVLVIGKNLKGIAFQMAKCCSPVYGDDVFGFVTISGGIKIHRRCCPNASALQAKFPYRIVPAKWAGDGGEKYPITLQIVGQDNLGIVNNITSVISKHRDVVLRSINIDANDGLFSGILTLMAENTDGLNALIKKIREIKGVKAVSRT